MSAAAATTVRGEVLTRDDLPPYAEDGDAYIVRDDTIVLERRGREWRPMPGAGDLITRTRARWYAALRDRDNEPQAYDIVDDFWPYDGPYSHGTSVAAAVAIGRLVRYLNNATQGKSGRPYASTSGDIIGNLSAVVYGLDQLLDQLHTAAQNAQADPTMYDARDRQHDPANAHAVAAQLAAELEHIRSAVGALRTPLERAHSLASRLGNRTPE